mgnify:CR=1 FL=1
MKTTLQPDAIVGVLLKGQPLIGRLLSLKGSKAVVSFGGQRRDQDLPLRDLSPTGASGNGPDRRVLPTPEAVQAISIAARTGAEAWWLLMSDAGDGSEAPCLCLAELTDLLLGFRGLADLAAVWAWLHSDQVWFRIRRDHTVQPRGVDDIRRQRQQSHRERLLDYKANSMAAADLDQYYKALDRALVRFHQKKMEDINKSIRELWTKTYKGEVTAAAAAADSTSTAISSSPPTHHLLRTSTTSRSSPSTRARTARGGGSRATAS